MTAAGLLPARFARLERFAGRWSIEGSQARTEARSDALPEERQAFYEAGASCLEEALDYLDAKGLEHFDAADQRLMNLMLSLAHVSLAQELQRDAEPTHAGLRSFLPITRTPAGA